MTPIDVATNHSLSFVEKFVRGKTTRVLEIGCGSGDLALALMNEGIKVRAIDISEEQIDRAKQKGIDAECADVRTYQDQPFDIVLFTRSLHHIEPLDDALAAAKRLMTPDGKLLIEDFLPEIVDEREVEWLRQKRAAIPSSIADENARRHTHISTVAEWREHHFGEHRIATGADVTLAVSRHFSIIAIEPVPYLYRYISDSIKPDATDGAKIVQAVCDEESNVIRQKKLSAIGMRIVARHQNA
jgi:ubiquinone/menaquinone biosynthesis C-methylase UbiE